MFKKLLIYLKQAARDRALRKSIAHFSAFFAVLAVFIVLTTHRIITRTPRAILPAEYAVLQTSDSTTSAVDLERDLRMQPGKVEGLVTFAGLNTIVVMGQGLEHDYVVKDADVDEMRKLATAAHVHFVEKSAVYESEFFDLLAWWWWISAIGLAVWLCFLLFRKREKGKRKSRAMVFFDAVPPVMDRLIARTRLRKSLFYLILFLMVLCATLGMFFGRCFHDKHMYVMPAKLNAHQLQAWQATRHLQQHPEQFQRVTLVNQLNAAYVVLRVPNPRFNADSTVKDSTLMVDRTVMFGSSKESRMQFNAFVDSTKARGIETKSVPARHELSYRDTMTMEGGFLFSIPVIITLFLGMVVLLNFEQWRDKERPEGSRRHAEVYAGGGSGDGIVEQRDEDRKTFADVAGCQEAIDELKVVKKKILRPRLYKVFGAPVPGGIILHGPPGTGKTLLARALAGEVNGSFWATSGSDFVEVYVGVGAKRVREAYTKARAAARKSGRISIIFIDEVDAIGKKRGKSSEGGDREYEQTLNQLLVEMNGFGNHGLVLTVAATNRLDILDEALLRPGRFDVKVQVPKPDKKGRSEIFEIYLRKHNVAVEGNTDAEKKEAYKKLLDDLGRRSHDFSGAEIEAAINEAATEAVETEFGDRVEDISEEQMEEYRKMAILNAHYLHIGIDKLAYGTQIKSRVRTEKERYATAVHEIGHAAVPTEDNGDKVNRITIVMTDKSLGLMDSSPEEGERYDWTREQFFVRIKTMLAGRAAEQVILKKVSTGASNDFERASLLARQMVGVFGMSEEFGVKSIPLDQAGFPASRIGERLSEKFNDAWSAIIDKVWLETVAFIEKHRVQIEHCAKNLFEEETLTGDEFRTLWAEKAPEQKEADNAIQ